MHYQQFLSFAALASTALAGSLTHVERQSEDCGTLQIACSTAPNANQSLCGSRKSACDKCEAAYEKYVTWSGSNKSYAGSFRSQCFTESTVGSGEGVAALVAALEAATGPFTTTADPSATTTTLVNPSGTTTSTAATDDLSTSTIVETWGTESTGEPTITSKIEEPGPTDVVISSTVEPTGNSTTAPTPSAGFTIPGTGKTGPLPSPTSTQTFNGAAATGRPVALGLLAIGAAVLL